MGYAFNNLIGAIIDFKLFAVMGNSVSIRDILIFSGIMILTFIFSAKIPGIIYRILLKRSENAVDENARLEGWEESDKKRTLDINKKNLLYFRGFLFWGIFLTGLTIAFVGADFNIEHEIGESGFQVSVMSILRFFGIILVTLFLGRLIPGWLIGSLNRFFLHLKGLRPGAREEGIAEAREGKQSRESFENLLHAFLRYSILIVGFAYGIATLGFEPDTKLNILGAEVTVINLVNSILTAVITTIFVVYFFPPILNIILTTTLRLYERRHMDEAERVSRLKQEVEKRRPGLYRTLLYLIILIGAHGALIYLPKESIYSFIEVVDIIIRALIVLAAAFLFTLLTPIFIYTLSATGKDFKKSSIYLIGRYINYLILLLSLFFIMSVVGLNLETPVVLGETNITVWSIISAIVVLVVTLIASRMIIAMLRDSILSPEQIDRHFSTVLERIIHVVIVSIGIAISLSVLGVNILAVATGVGLIGFALAFGMQDTIANFMAGIMIAVERPFKIGDRIRVGDEWGDVVDIGIRSTRIRTEKDEIVTIPNNLVATREVWNFTRDSPGIMMTVPIGISYDSDWHRAEEIILNVANRHPLVLKKPDAHVRMIRYGDSSIDLELWARISHAKYRGIVMSDILKAVKDRFDKEGIEIPYPYRTIVFKNEMDRMRMGDELSMNMPPGQRRLF